MLAHLKRAFSEVVGKDAEEFDSTVMASDVKYIRGIRDETTWTMSYSARAKSTMLTYRRPAGSATSPPKEVLLVREVDRKRKFPQTTAALSKASQAVSASVLVPNREAKAMMSGVNAPPAFKDLLAHPTNAIMIAKAIGPGFRQAHRSSIGGSSSSSDSDSRTADNDGDNRTTHEMTTFAASEHSF